MTYPNYTQEQMTAQYAKVNALVAQIETLVGEDPYREMTDAEVATIWIVWFRARISNPLSAAPCLLFTEYCPLSPVS